MLQGLVDCNAILKGHIARKSPRLMYQHKREECDTTSEILFGGFGDHQLAKTPSAAIGSPVLPAISFFITCVKKTGLFKRVHNLFCFSCVKMMSTFLIFSMKPLQHVVHTPLHHCVGGHWPMDISGQCGFSWMKSLCSGAEWEGTCYFSDDEFDEIF